MASDSHRRRTSRPDHSRTAERLTDPFTELTVRTITLVV